MNYQQTLEYLFAQLPMYQRVGAAAYRKDLKNKIEEVKALVKALESLPDIEID